MVDNDRTPLLSSSSHARISPGTSHSSRITRHKLTTFFLSFFLAAVVYCIGCGVQNALQLAPTVTMGFRRALEFLCALFFARATLSSTAHLPSYPLAVKSPYLSTWLPGTGMDNVAITQPEFWTGQHINWPVLARVDGTTYALLNSPRGLTGGINSAKTVNVTFTSTHTVFELSAEGVTFTLDFFSPVYPKNYTLQSLPYSYMSVNATSSTARHIQLFSAIDHTWTAQDGRSDVSRRSTGKSSFFEFYNANEIPFTEVNDQATWGSVVFGTSADEDVTMAANAADSVYKAFIRDGDLDSVSTTESGTNLAAISKDLGMVDSGGPGSITFAVGFERNSAINYRGQAQTGIHRTLWPKTSDALDFFLGHYDEACAISREFDATLRSRAESLSEDFGSQYADILEASVRQSFAAYELTVSLLETSSLKNLS